MTLYGVIFYVVSILTVITTFLAIRESHLVHSVVYLIASFLGTAFLFYLLGAPLLAAFEVIIYAGAIMVLFVFVIMTLKLEPSEMASHVTRSRWIVGTVLGGISFGFAAAFIISAQGTRVGLKTSMATPLQFGRFLFQSYWFGVEIVSLLLLIALVGALYLGRHRDKSDRKIPRGIQ